MKPLILFVHGLGGDNKGTWGDFPSLIASDPELRQRVDVEFYDYPTDVVRFFFFSVSLKIQDLAKSLKTAIDVKHGGRADDAKPLAQMIAAELEFSLADKELKELLAAAKGSPRFVKVFFANLLTLQRLGPIESVFSESLSQTRQEISP